MPTLSTKTGLWDERTQGITREGIDWNRPVSDQDLEYFYQLYPFIQLMNEYGDFEASPPHFFTTQSGWAVHDFGDIMNVSRGEALYDQGWFDNNELNEQNGGAFQAGKGTLAKQTFDTVAEIIPLIKEKDWGGIIMIDGTPSMAKHTWALAKLHGLNFEGLDNPTVRDQERYERLKSQTQKQTGHLPSLGN